MRWRTCRRDGAGGRLCRPAVECSRQSFALHCAAAPLAEELVFRGAVQGLLRPLGPRAAVCVQAALFAVQHGGAAGIAYALVLGVLLGTIRAAHRRVWPAGYCIQ